MYIGQTAYIYRNFLPMFGDHSFTFDRGPNLPMVLVSKHLSHKATSEAASDILYLPNSEFCSIASEHVILVQLLQLYWNSCKPLQLHHITIYSVEGQHLRVPQPNIALQKLQRSVELRMHLQTFFGTTLVSQNGDPIQYPERSPPTKDDPLVALVSGQRQFVCFQWLQDRRPHHLLHAVRYSK